MQIKPKNCLRAGKEGRAVKNAHVKNVFTASE